MFDPESSERVRVVRSFPVSRERMFRAWTDPEEFKRWWGPNGYSTFAAEMDVRPGGCYRITMKRPDGHLQYLFGTYVEVKPPDRLVMTWSLEGTETNDGYTALLSIELRAKGQGTEVVLLHEKIPNHALGHYERGWTLTLDRLTAFLEPASLESQP